MFTALESIKISHREHFKKAVAARNNGQLIDLSTVVKEGDEVIPVLPQEVDGLEVIRHSTAHLLAMAVKSLYPSVQVTIGPVIEEGYYYDFAFEDDTVLTPEDFTKIEKAMRQIVKKSLPITREEVSRNDAIKYFENIGEHYKVEIIKAIPGDEVLSLYQQGDFKDLCRGPHVKSTAQLGAFKLTKVAGAYWRGDSNNKMLQRVYGTAWDTKEALEHHLEQVKEREKRNHKKIAEQADLFHFQPEAPGMVFWHHKGWFAYQAIIQFVRQYYSDNGYEEVNTPMLLDRALWEASGHWDKFQENMFQVESEQRLYAVKPMNCPAHVQIFKNRLRSYRDLPLRMGEFGTCHRNEPSGTLQGLMRLRAFVQDDGHIFCTEKEIADEVTKFMHDALKVYRMFGFDQVTVRFSTRPDVRVGEDAIWDHSEVVLEEILDEMGIDWSLAPGEGAFYGPKLELSLKDSLGRTWQCGTIQLDFSMPDRLGASYIDSDGQKKVPVMLHRAMLGSLERFLGILIENTFGWLPIWMHEVQVIITGISDKHQAYALEVEKSLRSMGVRSKCDLRSEKVGMKIREHILNRIPFIAIVGDEEINNQTVSVRTGQGEQMGSIRVEALAKHINQQQQEFKLDG
ncbi:threonine--tRNA ligase [Gammaproteobacteria bacterium]|nr:threonine--tRNA ligase [Gammaproteobacteria bacterium]